MAPAQSYHRSAQAYKNSQGKSMHTLRETWPLSQALATAYTYDRLAFNFVYISAIFANERKLSVDLDDCFGHKIGKPCIS